MFFFFLPLNVIWKARKREYSSDKVIVQRPQNEFNNSNLLVLVLFTAIWRKVVAKNVYATIPKGNRGYDQYAVPDTVAI